MLFLIGRRPGADRKNERGVMLLMASMLMVFLLTVAAFAIDLGNLRQKQVNFQGAVDLAALAGAQDLPNGNTATNEALDSIEANLGIPRTAWVGCNDPGALPNVVVLPDTAGSNCISFNQDFTIIRVALPEQAIQTYFGSIIGVEEMALSTSAEAAAIVARSNRIIPATVSAAVDPGLRCVESSGANTGCPNHVDGFFGTIHSPRLYQFKPSSGNYNGGAQALNFALNLDHDVVPFNTGDLQVCDGSIMSPCVGSNDNNSGLAANHLIISTGNSVPPVTEGLVTGGKVTTSDFGDVKFCGRLTRPDFDADNSLDPLPEQCQSPGEPTIQHIGYTINGRHIYHWLTPDARNRFYSELNVPAGVMEPPLTDNIYHAGDNRLQCFMDGYRLDVSTGNETIPDCSSVGLNLPRADGLEYLSTWTNSYAGYADPGKPAWGEPWHEPSGDKAEMLGWFQMRSDTNEIIVTKSAPSTESLWRRVNLPAGTDAIEIKGEVETDKNNSFAFEYSLDNAHWTQIIGVNSPGVFPHNVMVETGGAHAVWLRYRRTVDSVTQGQMKARHLTIDAYDRTSPVGHRVMDPIFEPGMLTDVRFSAIPIITDWPANGTKASPIAGFWYAFIYDLYGNNTKVQAFDAWVFDPALAGHDRNTAFSGYGFDLNAFIRLER